jgi:hypothetical protein
LSFFFISVGCQTAAKGEKKACETLSEKIQNLTIVNNPLDISNNRIKEVFIIDIAVSVE